MFSIRGFSKEVYSSRRMITSLAINDFKMKYAGSYLGIVWAFVQPIVTILVYWAVFQVGFRSGQVEKVPFILWLMSGLIPWFFYYEAMTSATNCYFEYSYLVKKVLFKISILPIVKIISSFFVHIFFLAVMLLIFLIYGVYPTLYALQLIYYVGCLIAITIALSYITSSIVVFLKDFGQIVAIIMQFGIWVTPIMWNYKMVPENWRWVFKINPMYYVVEGYRDSMFNHVWFWDKINETLWFWNLTLLYFVIGYIVFKKLKPHFSDVL
ncbi:ABC transporter permease [Paenibacillus sp. CGMCC 1.18879]|uniref:ABC transporter permease n=1 Tax=Paenibacillus sp. CGMCC 1.18879 TaxID=2834466 RepID=UPI001CA949CE|nr:ABC transporter permease [Paenibacillus sp. CGMCC 1.18879]MBY9077526.1 ABC transporter permease [Paenibacillus sp. CGMCC 1.18879]